MYVYYAFQNLLFLHYIILLNRSRHRQDGTTLQGCCLPSNQKDDPSIKFEMVNGSHELEKNTEASEKNATEYKFVVVTPKSQMYKLRKI